MNCVSTEDLIHELYHYAVRMGFTEDLFLDASNLDSYVHTAVDAYRDYPLFLHVFGGKYDKKTLTRMMIVDFKSRLGTIAGLASSSAYESILLVEPPNTKKTGMLQYIRSADISSYTLLFKPAIYRQESFENFALEKRTPWLDENTWYIYIFATRKDSQGRGYGKDILHTVLSFADAKGARVCLETNQKDNVSLYSHFGFKTMDSSVYRNTLEHYVMLYDGAAGTNAGSTPADP